MDRYSEFARDLREIPNVQSFSSRATILPLREFPQACDQRRERSCKKNQDIERSRADQPHLVIPEEPYKLRRIVVPPTRLQYIEPSRIPNARDPRGLRACRKFNTRSKKWKYVPNWVPTLVENEEILQEEETCAVLVIDNCEWLERGIKHSYIQMIPHECNVQRSVAEMERQLADIVDAPRVDELLMTPEEAREAENNMQTSTRNDRVEYDSDIEECDSEGEVLPREAPARALAVFGTVEDKPMLEMNYEPIAGPSNQKVPRSRPIDEDEEEDRVIYEPAEPEERPVPRLDDSDVECINIDAEQPTVKKEPQAPTATTFNDADVVCIDLESDEEEQVVPKKEPQEQPTPPIPRLDDADVVCIDLDSDEKSREEIPTVPKKEAHMPFDKNLPCEVLDEITISDSEEEDWGVLYAMQLSIDECETNKSKADNSQPTYSGAVASLHPTGAREDSLEKTADQSLRTGENNMDNGEQVTKVGHNSSNEHCVVEQKLEMPHDEAGRCIQNHDCDSDLKIGSDIPDTVISKSRPVKINVNDEAVDETEDSVGFGAKVPETWDIADETDRSSDSDSDMPTAMQLETLADVHEEPVRDKVNGDVNAHSEISQVQEENEELNIPVAANIAQKRKRIDNERLDTDDVNELQACTIITGDIKRRKENDDAAANDENQSDNCKALVKRALLPVFKGLPRRRNKRMNKKPSESVLQLSSTSTCAISKPSSRNQNRSIVFSRFTALGILKEYLKNYNTTYACLNFFSKHFEKLSFVQFLRFNEYVKRNNDFWQNRYNHWHREENNVFIEDVIEENQLAIESAHAFKPVIEEAASVLQSEQSCRTSEDMITVTGNSCLVQGNTEDNYIGKILYQKRHSLPMPTIPQQSFGVKRPRSGSNDNPIIKLTLKRSQADDNKWIATTNANTMPNISVQNTLLNLNNSTQNALEQQISNKRVDLETNKATVSENKVLPKWSYIDKEVPELDLDDFVNRPLQIPQRIDKSKVFSLSLQCRIKKRSASVDSAIVSDYDENSSKRMKLTNPTKECEFTMDNSNYDEDEFSYNDNIGEFLEITDVTPDSCSELSTPQSEDVCHLNNNNNNEDTFVNSEKQMSSNLEILPKDYPSNTVNSEEKALNVNEKRAQFLENINQDLQADDASSASDSSFQLRFEDEFYDSPKNTAQSQDLNIQIDYNYNLQKDENSFDEPCNKTSNYQQNEIYANKDLKKQTNLNNLYTKEVDRLYKKMENLFGNGNINEVEQMVAKKYNYKKYQTVELRNVQKDGQTDNLMETWLQSPIEEKQPTANTLEQSSIKDSQFPAPNSTELVFMKTITTNEKQLQQQIFDEKDVDSDPTHENKDHVKVSMSNEKDWRLESGLMTTYPNEEQEQQTFGKEDVSIDLTHEINEHNEISMNNEKDLTLEPGLMTTDPNEEQEQQTFGKEAASTDLTHEISMSNKKKLVLETTSLENQDRIITSESSNTSNLQSDLSKNVNEHEDCLDVQNSQVLINNEKLMKCGNPLESESNLSKDNEISDILNEKIDSEVQHCNINDDLSLEHSSLKDEKMVGHEKCQKSGNDSYENQERSDINASSSSCNQEQRHLEMIGLEDGFEEGDLDFHTSIHGFKPNSKYSDDDYDVSSDDEYENQATGKYLQVVSVQKSSESLVPNVDTNTSNCVSNTSEKEIQSLTIRTEQLSTISEDEHLHNSQKSSLKITNTDTIKSNWHLNDSDKDDDGIVIEYEKINNDINHLKDVKPDRSNINNDLGVQVSGTSELEIPNDITSESQPILQKVASPTLLSVSNVHDKDLNVELIQLQTGTNTETINSLNESGVETSVSNLGFPPSPTVNNSSISPSSENISVNSTLTVESTIRSSANVVIDFNNQKMLEKFNLNKEIIAPEDIKAENSVAFDNNDEEQTLCNTLENMLKEDSRKEYSISKVINQQNSSKVVLPLTSLVFDVSLPTDPQSRNTRDLLKDLNINVDNDVDIIAEKTVDKNFAQQGFPVVLKVKNLNDMLKKPNVSPENTSSKPQTIPGNSLSNVPENSQQNSNHGAVTFQEQSVDMLPPPPLAPSNNPILNALIIQPSYACTVNQQMPDGIQPLMNMCNVLPASIPMVNNIGQQMYYTNTGLVNQGSMQNNVQISVPLPTAPVTLDKPFVFASSIFTNLFDKHTTLYCNKTVFSLQLPPLPNIILPPPHTILHSDDHSIISNKIQDYKFKLLNKLVQTLGELENTHINIRDQVDILNRRETLTAETWIIQEKMLVLAQCVGSFKKLTTEKNYKNIIHAIMGSISSQVTDHELLRKFFGIFLNFKTSGIFRSHVDEQQPLTVELGAELQQTVIGMSSTQKEVLKYQIKIYQEMLKINKKQIQCNKVAQLNTQMKNQNPVQLQRSSHMALQQDIVTTTVSSPVTDIANNSFQNPVNIQHVQPVTTESLPETTKEQQLGNEKQNPSIQRDISKMCLRCGKPSKIICRGCSTATYCSSDCQTIHWKAEHCISCKSVNSAF